jgi:hypothetical protein
LFVTPLVVRVFAQPGFPYSYVSAVRNRTAEARDVNGRSALETVAAHLHVPVIVVIGMLVGCLVLGIGLLLRRHVSGVVIAVTALYAGLVISVSPPQSRVATELAWILGLGMFWRGVFYASPVIISSILWKRVWSRRVGERDLATSKPVLRRSAGLVLSLAVLVALYPMALRQAFTLPLSTSGGTPSEHVPSLVDAMLEATDDQPLMLVLGNRWFALGAAPLLELERRDADYCVVVPTPFLESFDTFLPSDRLCQPKVAGTAFVLDDSGQDLGIPQQTMVFRQPIETYSPDGAQRALAAWAAPCTRGEALYPACVNWPDTVVLP